MVRKAHQQRMDMRSMLLAACGSEAFYEALVAEYKRNFSNLLAGRYASTADHLLSYTKGEGAEDIDTDRAIELTVRLTAMNLYFLCFLRAAQ